MVKSKWQSNDDDQRVKNETRTKKSTWNNIQLSFIRAFFWNVHYYFVDGDHFFYNSFHSSFFAFKFNNRNEVNSNRKMEKSITEMARKKNMKTIHFKSKGKNLTFHLFAVFFSSIDWCRHTVDFVVVLFCFHSWIFPLFVVPRFAHNNRLYTIFLFYICCCCCFLHLSSCHWDFLRVVF